ncbi:MAG: 1-deoxy-D-xylulose-5-phosphate reductoisomerase [Candidatus Omnitrophica bacterium]|jgi:1-deoxy-D-xylulose-5-phosphate reductoisomerase|nr:1-deoxy-D-xylulose-5-phosphate reductoisomerase [Candidatus Omnitrophota bacterium]
MKTINIFGSTGSIGKNALDVIRKNKKDFKVLGLCAHTNIDALYAQIKEFSPSYVCVVNEESAEKIKNLSKKIKLFKGQIGLYEFASINCDISLMAISGISALRPLMINIEHAKKIALANKESIVTAGNFVLNKAKQFKTKILPVDSEINALYQLFTPQSNFSKVYLTASGGALFDYKPKDLNKVCVKTVLSHPTWRMGKRITIDSATLVNKGFEVVESHYFFNLPYENIDIVIHRESNVHAFVEFKDKTLFACMYPPDMRIPISFALSYPKRIDALQTPNFRGRFSLSFEPLHAKQFPLLDIILKGAKRGGNSLAVLNGCDEVAIEYFLSNKIKFTDIYRAMNYIFSHYKQARLKALDDVFYWDNWAKEKTKEYLRAL